MNLMCGFLRCLNGFVQVMCVQAIKQRLKFLLRLWTDTEHKVHRLLWEKKKVLRTHVYSFKIPTIAVYIKYFLDLYVKVSLPYIYHSNIK